jgi:hypothetical protein
MRLCALWMLDSTARDRFRFYASRAYRSPERNLCSGRWSRCDPMIRVGSPYGTKPRFTVPPNWN